MEPARIEPILAFTEPQEIPMKIGEPEREIEVWPLEEPIPGELPVEAPEPARTPA